VRHGDERETVLAAGANGSMATDADDVLRSGSRMVTCGASPNADTSRRAPRSLTRSSCVASTADRSRPGVVDEREQVSGLVALLCRAIGRRRVSFDHATVARHRGGTGRGCGSGTAALAVRSHGVTRPKRAAFPLGDGLEAHDDALLFAGLDGKMRVRSMPRPCTRRARVAVAPNDVLVDLPRALGRHGLAGHELAVDLELERLERGAGGHGEDVIRFAHQPPRLRNVSVI
jgi:hypothetical protein